MSSFCTAKATHFFSKKFQHICVSLNLNFNESLTKDIVSFEQLGPDVSEEEYKYKLKSWRCSGLDLNQCATREKFLCPRLSPIMVFDTRLRERHTLSGEGRELCSNCLYSLLKRVYSKRKEFAPFLFASLHTDFPISNGQSVCRNANRKSKELFPC